MSSTYKISVLALLIVIVFAASIFAAPAKVGRLGLSKEANFTILTIEADKQMQVAHESVEAKEGKPFRIVIDCLAARHSLPDKSYQDLPTSIITSIRTSQYAVDPEEVVRIVLDLKAESVYRVESKDNTVRILVSDAGNKVFSQWSTPRATGFAAKIVPKAETPALDKNVKKTDTKANSTDTPKIQLVQGNKSIESKKQQLTQTESKNKNNSQMNDSPIDKKPIPLQERLALAKVDETKGINNSPVINNTESKPMANESKKMAEKPKQANVTTSKLTVVSPQPQKEAEVQKKSIKTAEINTTIKNSKPNINELKNDSVNRALTFAAAPQKKEVPTPGDAPKPKESDNKDVHKNADEKSKAHEKQTEVAATKSATSMTVETPKVTVVQQPQKTEKPKVTIAEQKPTEVKPMVTVAQKAQKTENPKVTVAEQKPTEVKPKVAVAQKPQEVEKPKLTVAQEKQIANDAKANPAQITQAKKNTILASLEPEKPATSTNESKVEKQSDKEVEKKDRSRFRRESARSAKYKQTQVVQFPQRMVIKYNGSSTRDPFETLIDVTKKNLGPADLSKIPNIETLNLVGIIEAAPGGKDAALLEDLDGIGYILKTGDRIKNGYVGRIDKRAVYFQLNEYGWNRTVTKQLEKEK
ncbi:MAG: hypothetical protein ABIE07_08825 [Candidatus Zixiibacteriota bacterium]